jgi:hypothetical protein
MRVLFFVLLLFRWPAFAQAVSVVDVTARLDELWKTRDDSTSLKASDDAIVDGLKTFPEDAEILWRASRLRWWVADGATESKLRKQLSREGWTLGERGVKAKADGMQAHYYIALNIGAYSQAVGILKALSEGLEGKFNDELEKARKGDTSYDRYGPKTAKGRYYWELPWPKRDLEKSRLELKSVLEKHPEHLRAWLYLAETELKDGKTKEAKACLDKVQTGAEGYDPPEARRIKKWAKDVSNEIEKELK